MLSGQNRPNKGGFKLMELSHCTYIDSGVTESARAHRAAAASKACASVPRLRASALDTEKSSNGS